MKSKFNIVEGFVPATPRSQRKKNAAAGGGSTVVVEGSGGEGSVSDPNSHTHTNLPLLESLADQDGYLTRKEENPDTGENADPFIYTKVKAGFADKAEDSEKWKGKAFADFLDQPVRKADSVEHKSVTVSESVTSKDFRQGDFSGSGFGMYHDANGNAVAEVDIVKVRKEAIFNEAVINQVTFQVGATVFSNGGCEITRVEELDDVYRCYYDTKEGRRLCGLVVDDQVRCQQYDPSQNTIVKYYWRLVVAVGDDYVDLSKTDVDGTGVPEEGDEIAQFGHRTDKTRQGATIIDPKDGSSVVVYSEINSYSLVKKNFVGLGTNPQTGRPYLYCYGDFFLGDRELKNQFLTFQIPEGQTVPQLIGELNIKLGAGSSGLDNLTEWAEKQQQIDNAGQAAADAQDTANTAQQTAEDAARKAQEAKDYINSTLPEELAEINRKLDGVVENWFYSYSPTLENEPAASWIRDGEQAKHEGDTFTNTQAYVDAGATPDAGKSWRWVKDGSAWKWTPIADSDAVKALQQAAQAQDTADSKRRVFVVQPTTPYDVGDMWSQGSNGDLMRCIKSRASGAFDASDWDKASKYTDDTVALEAKQAAQTAQQTANTAREEAQKVKDQQEIFASDSYISPMEKTSLKQQQADIQAEYGEIISRAGQYSISTAAYASAYTAAKNALAKYTASTPENIPVESDYANIAAYYTARQTILDAIAAAAKQYVDDVEFSSINLIDGSEDMIVPLDWAPANYKAFPLGRVVAGEQLALSVESIDLLSGDPVSGFSASIYDSTGAEEIKLISNQIDFSTSAPYSGVFNLSDTTDEATLILYSGIPWVDASGRSASYKKVMLVRGNKPCMTWAPSVNDQKQAAIDGVQVGMVNLVKRGNYGLKDVATYFITTISLNKGLVSGNKYTLIISGNVTGRQYFGLWDSSASGRQGIATHIQDNIYSITFTFNPSTNANNIVLRLYNVPESTAPNDPCDVDWVCLYEGDVKTPYTFVESIYDVQEDIDAAKKAANEAKSRLDMWASDGYISPTEKTALKQQQADIQAEYAEIMAQAGQYSVSTTTYASAYTAANNALAKYTASTPENIPVESDYANIASYYTARKTILDAISQAAQEYVNSKVSDLDYLKEVFPNAMLDVNGVVLAQLLGVKSSTEEDAAVVAGFYGGSDETLNAAGFKDPTHGILMMFAGAENVQSAASAKTRVYGDGSLFTQMLYADGGKIGGFTIQESSLQAGASDADNLYLSNSLLKFSSGDYTGSVYIGSNIMPGVSGMKGLMRMELEGDVGTLMYTKATKVGGLSIDRVRSWTNYGDLFSIGSKVFASDKFRGTVYTDTIELNFDQTDTFIFSYSANSGTTMAVNLPSLSDIESKFGSRYVTFKLTLLCERSFSGTIRITAPFSAPLLNNSGNIINGGDGYVDMGRGDVIVLQYAPGYYYFVSRMN